MEDIESDSSRDIVISATGNRTMRATLLVFLLLIAGCIAREVCNNSNCALPDCYCSGVKIPRGLPPAYTPQMVMITFDDAVTKINFYDYFRDILFNRVNPNGCNISATFFVSHDYNDYSLTNKLYRQGHEIALHSITHNIPHKASVHQLTDDFIGMKEILNRFGRIPYGAIKGIRAPHLQMAGDNTFQMMEENNIEWDSSWPTFRFTDPPMWPYTLDHRSIQDCPIPPCPKKPFPRLWEVPLVDWLNEDGSPCAMVDTCPYIQDPDQLLNFMKRNFHRHYDNNRAPFPLFMHAAWFDSLPTSYEVYEKFLDYLSSLPDVYMVSISQVIKWIKHPTPTFRLRNYWKCWNIPKNECGRPRTCKLVKEKTGNIHYMDSCTKCPDVFPWIGNPSGKRQTDVHQ